MAFLRLYFIASATHILTEATIISSLSSQNCETRIFQGVVPCKTEKMASRLVHIVTDRLLTVEEAFGRMDPSTLASLLQPLVEEELMKEKYGKVVVKLLQPILPMLLTRVVANLQKEIEDILDLQSVVLEAFMRDKKVLVELFQKVCILIVYLYCLYVSILQSCN